MDSNAEDQSHNGSADQESLEHLISIWPIASTIATHLPAGDLISLARTSRSFRSYTHGFPYISGADDEPELSGDDPNHLVREVTELHVGYHQTSQWANLKSLAPFVCSFPSHKDPKSAQSNPCRPCKYCSRPICRTCIVRSFFTDPKSSKNTYIYRTRHLCQKCWSSGNLRKDYRYPADSVSREQIWQGRSYAQRGNWCNCTASEDNWVCGGCKLLQNESGYWNLPISGFRRISNGGQKGKDSVSPREIPCYGLGCDVVITEVNRDRRRICLWCSKPLVRQYAGEDRLRWEEKQVEIRAAAAASRSADIGEWARNRFRSLTMSRRQLRGTEACIELTGSDGPEHDEPIFVRHLDAINYRQFMGQHAAPSPDSVYTSKHGRWTYSREFLVRVHQSLHAADIAVPSGTSGIFLYKSTKEDGLGNARRNAELYAFRGSSPRRIIEIYAAQLQEARLIDHTILTWILKSPLSNKNEFATVRDILLACLNVWENLADDAREDWRPRSFWNIVVTAGLITQMELRQDTTLIAMKISRRERGRIAVMAEVDQLTRKMSIPSKIMNSLKRSTSTEGEPSQTESKEEGTSMDVQDDDWEAFESGHETDEEQQLTSPTYSNR